MSIMYKSLLTLLLLQFAAATPTPQVPVPTKCGMGKTSCPAIPAAAAASFGGIPKLAFAVRGGEVLEANTKEEMESILIRSAGSLVVVDHWATWCGPCRMIAPLFAELSEEYADVVFVKVDVDENPDTAAMYSVSAMPTFVFVKNGQVVDRLMGANVKRLTEMIQEHQ